MFRKAPLFFLFFSLVSWSAPSSRLFISSSFSLNKWEGFGFSSGFGLALQRPQSSRWIWTFENKILLVPAGSVFTTGFGAKRFVLNHFQSSQSLSLGGSVGFGFPGGGLEGDPQLGMVSAEIAYQRRWDSDTYYRLIASPGLIGKNVSMGLGIVVLFQII